MHQTFGGLQIIQNEQPLPIAHQRKRTLLTYLLLHPTVTHPQGKLIELLWPETASERSGGNFANGLAIGPYLPPLTVGVASGDTTGDAVIGDGGAG